MWNREPGRNILASNCVQILSAANDEKKGHSADTDVTTNTKKVLRPQLVLGEWQKLITLDPISAGSP